MSFDEWSNGGAGGVGSAFLTPMRSARPARRRCKAAGFLA